MAKHPIYVYPKADGMHVGEVPGLIDRFTAISHEISPACLLSHLKRVVEEYEERGVIRT